MMKCILIWLFLLPFPLYLAASSGPDPRTGSSDEMLWEQANRYYADQQYDSALAFYGKILEDAPDNALVYYNAGNARYRLNHIGWAVWNYRKALQLDPDLKQAAENLLLTESRISNYIQPAPELFFVNWWHKATKPSAATVWGIASLVLFLLLLGLVFLFCYRNRHVRIRPQLPGAVAGLWLICLFFAFAATLSGRADGKAVVIVQDAPMVSGPQQPGAQSYIPEGTTVEITDSKAGFHAVRLPDGRTGWMQQQQLAGI